MLALYGGVALGLGFLIYVLMFGASSTGFIGKLHDWMCGCYCLRPIMRRLCGPKCDGPCGRCLTKHCRRGVQGLRSLALRPHCRRRRDHRRR